MTQFLSNLTVDYLAIQEEIAQWLELMSEGLAPGRFRFCRQGSFVPVEGQRGLVSTVFAMKIAWQIGIWECWPETKRRACIDFVRAFQKEDGRFVDPWIVEQTKIGLKDHLRHIIKRDNMRSRHEKEELNVCAETRQAAASLIMVGTKPEFPLPVRITSAEEVAEYITSFDWSKPWNAASQLSKQLMFLSANKKSFSQEHSYDLLIDEVLKCLERMWDPSTGTWFVGNPSESDKINGAMKIFTGLQWTDREYPDCTRLLEFALQQPYLTDGCGFLNRLFVVYQCRRAVPKDFKKAEISLFASKTLEQIQQFKKEEGGFSFYPNKAQTIYLGVNTSRGDPVSDMHGTVMMSWALAIIADLLGDAAPTSAKQWRVHRS